VLSEAGLLAVAKTVPMLAVTLDQALSSEELSRARAAFAALETSQTGARIQAAIEGARTRHRPRATGLPRGMELLARDPADAAMPAIAPLVRAAEQRKKDVDAAIDAELAELKKRIGG
jgi:hypothetical protein